MPQTRLGKSRNQNDKVPQHVLSDGDGPEPNDIPATPPSAPFKDQLSNYAYKEQDVTSNEVSTSTNSNRPRKRPRTATIAAVGSARGSTQQPTKKRKAGQYALPSKYAHLSPLVDILEPNLICVFVGTNPGVQTATAGHAYAHPSNHFWKLLHASGLTNRRLKPEEDRSLPGLFCMGNTNIVDRPSKNAAELSKEEMSAGTASLDAKFLKYKPEAVCIVGKGIWEAIWRYRYGKNPGKNEFKYGWQDEKHNMGKCPEDGEQELDANGNPWKGTKVFVTTSTSGLAASLTPAEKEAIWRPFGEWVQKRREERGFVPRLVEAQSAVEETAQL
ncbi:hypothetical protein GGP41_008559 [Bipolaris sorokiniana]|uniref:Uracil-DNA glycosylase-like domain-containing protein n=2 Tax=Cochliobolus sativus TaxID=45130 RepID=A0A8H5ZAZ9_COCSA|nr:uncharacterized protein COCSADRAFT_40835 [Bipolaris sorokiniana ND90Pr]EMD59660.1 hypothetical protein COCSADRAFT_40835 [Bipolaris sorokiniana ND90Pr]KAF5846055.1 hypothetical protein GGP41_008559 [Bipolaris sorokiniana]